MKQSALYDFFKNAKEFNGKFFESVFAHRTMVNEFLNMFKKAITDMDAVMLVKVKKCFDAQYALLP